jgi:hypothetical protein
MYRLARELHMEYREKDRWGLKNLLRDFKLFSKGRWRKIEHMLYRADELLNTEVYIFDYYFRRGKGKSKHHWQTVFFVHSKYLGLPHFEMKPETLLHKVGELLGFKDIDFEEYPVFSRKYRLKGPDEDFIRATWNDRVLHFFSEERKWHLEGINYYMVFYRPGKRMAPAEIRTLYHKGMEVFRLLSDSNKKNIFDL